MDKKLIILLVLLLVIPLASAKVTQVSVGDVGLDIRIPQAEFIKQNEGIQVNLHVFNKSTGVLLDNTTTECLLHIHNKTGEIQLNNDLQFDEENLDFFVDIDGNNFSQLGFLSYVLQCNTSTNEGGFVSGSVRVTETGEDDSPNNIYPVIIGIIAIIAFFGILGYSHKESLGLRIACFAVVLVEIVNLAFMLYLHESAKSMISMLRINFWITFFIVFGIGAIALIFLFMRALNLEDSMEDEGKKWQERK